MFRETMTAISLITFLACVTAGCFSDSGGGGDQNHDSGVFPNPDPDAGSGTGDADANEDAGRDAQSGPRAYTGLDILWVIDNSGSMCEEQAALRDNFDQFISEITDRNIDFHIGVTTTQMEPYVIEPVAQAGHLQSTPQPLVSPIPICHGQEGATSDPDDGFLPVREAIDLAVNCTTDPAQWDHLNDVTDDEIACQLRSGLPGCSCNDDPDDNDVCSRENLFPNYDNGTSPYRSIPKVLRYSDYQDQGQLDLAGLKADFACMSMVGTSGHSVEKGLAAAAKAVSPEMTGGTATSIIDADAPNHGFLRENAKFSVIFMTDENDCSHDGTLDESTPCHDDVCAFANDPDLQDSPLIPSEDFAQSVIANLSSSKGHDVEKESIIAASIHGRWDRYGATADYPSSEPPETNACTELPPDSTQERPSCQSVFGTAYSGDRYERFLRQFVPDQVFPSIPSDPNVHMNGLICRPDAFSSTLQQIGAMLANSLDA